MGIFTTQALSFNGSSQYINRSNVSTANDNFTVIAVVNYTSFGAGTSSIFNNGSTDGNGYVLRVSSAGVFNLDFSFIANLSSAYTLSTGTWYQLAVIRNAGTSQCYVNAVAQGSTSSSTPNSPQSWVTVGASQVAAGTAAQFANAKIQEVRQYDRAISTTELTQLYNRLTNTRDYGDISNANLITWLKLDGTYLDTSPSPNHFAQTGSPTFVTGYAEAYRAKPGEGNEFRYISVGNGMSRSEGAT